MTMSALTNPGHSVVTLQIYIHAVIKDNPYRLPSVVVAAVAMAYLLFVIMLLVCY
jgi:hypothetical protein